MGFMSDSIVLGLPFLRAYAARFDRAKQTVRRATQVLLPPPPPCLSLSDPPSTRTHDTPPTTTHLEQIPKLTSELVYFWQVSLGQIPLGSSLCTHCGTGHDSNQPSALLASSTTLASGVANVLQPQPNMRERPMLNSRYLRMPSSVLH